MRTLNQATLDLLKGFERLVLHPYDDGYGYKTIGWGHLIKPGETFGNSITREEADRILRQDLEIAQRGVEHNVTVALNDNQYGAITSFVFNLGEGNFKKSSVLTYLNQGNFAKVPERMKLHNKSAGKVSKGLIRRRAAETLLFRTPVQNTALPQNLGQDNALTEMVSNGINTNPIPQLNPADAMAAGSDAAALGSVPVVPTPTTAVEIKSADTVTIDASAPVKDSSPFEKVMVVTNSWSARAYATVTGPMAVLVSWIAATLHVPPQAVTAAVWGIIIIGGLMVIRSIILDNARINSAKDPKAYTAK